MAHPAIDFERAGGVDLDRLERSLKLEGRRVGEGRYHVAGGDHDHWVDLYTTSIPRCDCGDHLWWIGSASTSSPPCSARETTRSFGRSAPCSSA